MSERHITYDKIYNTVDRDDFDSLIEVERYADGGCRGAGNG